MNDIQTSQKFIDLPKMNLILVTYAGIGQNNNNYDNDMH